jgi:hypothetical protein
LGARSHRDRGSLGEAGREADVDRRRHARHCQHRAAFARPGRRDRHAREFDQSERQRPQRHHRAGRRRAGDDRCQRSLAPSDPARSSPREK